MTSSSSSSYAPYAPYSSTKGVAASTLTFVLSLCLPYTSASPVPSASAMSRSPPTGHFEQYLPAARDTVRTAGRILRRLAPGDDDVATVMTSAISKLPPKIGLARLNPQGLYQIPQEYVILVQQFNGGFIVLSYAIAFVGSLCTLELLVRRTTNAGWRNKALLASAGITFGAVSTFAMHFIFNNSLSLHHPRQSIKHYPSLRLAYDPGFTVLSLIVSCVAMTMAFFIMGTSLRDWWCFPGARRRSRRSRKSRRRSSTASEWGKNGDEYGRWKDTHKRVLRRGTVGMGALLGRGGSVAKWSMMDGMGSDEKAGPRLSKTKGKRDPNGTFGDEGSTIIQHDKELAELDFRLGRSAVEQELSRRIEPKPPRVPVMPTAPAGVKRDSIAAMHPMASDSSLPAETQKVFYPTARRGSVATMEHINTSEIFSPGFSFPAKEDPSSSTARLIPSSASFTARTVDQTVNGWPEADLATPAPQEYSRRRASLPVVAYSVPRLEQPVRSPITLSRIQSLPEADQEGGTSSRSSSVNRPNVASPGLSIDAHLATLKDASPNTAQSPIKHVEFQRQKPMFSAVEKFLGFDVVTREEIIKIFFTGTLAGCGVAAMHYIGQLSITGLPYIAYKAPYVIGSVIIASGAVVIALYIMFIMLRPKLKHTWVSKIAVALILAVAVCAMHFCGMMGTIYAWPVGAGITPSDMITGTNKVITAIVAALAFVACIACAVFFVLHSLKLRRERARRRRVVVAAVFLDQQNRVLVNSTDGVLPMCDIASLTGHMNTHSSRQSSKSTGNASWNSKSTVLGMDLTTGHDAFVAALKMSWSWKNPAHAPSNTFAPMSEETMVTGVQTLSGTIADIRRGSMQTTDSSITSPKQSRLSVAKFLERFALSSGQLAIQLLGQQDGISRLGVLYDQILTTGWVKLANSNDTVSKGQLIFLVRRVTSSAERSDLLAKHFIFAEPHAVAQALHKTLSVPYDHTVPLLDDISNFCDSTLRPTLRPGVVYAGVAVVQATPFDGLRILLEQDRRAQLPMREIGTISPIVGSPNMGELSGTVEELGEAIRWLEGLSLLSIITRNMALDAELPGGPRVAKLLQALERAIVPMLDEMLDAEDMSHILPRLHLHPVLLPLTPGGLRKTSKIAGYTPPYIIVFYATYDAAVNTFTDKWLPFSLFRAQYSCVMAPHIASARKADQLFNPPSTGGESDDNENHPRRPSRVQFEVPSEHHSPSPVNATPRVMDLPSSPQSSQSGGEMFSGFSFPPKVAQTANNGHGTVQGIMVGSTSPTMPQQPTIGGHGAKKGYLNNNTSSMTQRRSSLVTRSQFGSDVGGALEKYNMGGGGEVLLGVATWDPDWLSTLLRTKLRAEA